jgi:hypothetical protein
VISREPAGLPERQSDRCAPEAGASNAAVAAAIINYNGVDLLKECLDSLFAQRHPVSELVVIDNRSADQSVTLRLVSLRVVADTGHDRGRQPGHERIGVSQGTHEARQSRHLRVCGARLLKSEGIGNRASSLRAGKLAWRWQDVLPVLPVLLPLLFVRLYATGMPLTDEWSFTKSVMAIQQIDASGIEWLRQAWTLAAFRFNEHWVAIPFLSYWALAGLVHFDSRVFTYITIATWVLQLAIYARHVIRSWIATLPIALVLFSPSHFMELLWGFQFAFALSIAFSMLGLVVLDNLGGEEPRTRRSSKVFASIGLFLLGTLSATGGFFGFLAGIAVVNLKRLTVSAKVIISTGFLLVAAFTYALLLRGFGRPISFSTRNVYYVLTALGGTIWGTPVRLFEFGSSASP